MASTGYSTYSQAAAQQGAYTAQPTQGYTQTTQAYGQQSYGTYGQSADVSYSQAQTTTTYGQTACATSYGQPPTGCTTPTAPQAYSQPVQGYDTGAYDTTTAIVTTTQASYAAQSAYGTQPAYPAYGQQMVTSPLRLDMDRVTTVIPRYLGSLHLHPTLLPAIPLHTRLVMIKAVTVNRTPMGNRGSYGQQSSYGQQPPTSYPPQTGSYSQASRQYSQQSSSYRQQSSFQQDHPSSMGIYGQESGGFSGPGENQSMSGPDNQGRGRGGFDHGGMTRGGLGGMGAGEQGGPDLDLSPPVDPDEDSDNSAIYVQGLNDNVTLDDLADFFKQCEAVKMNKRTGQPMIHISLDKETGKPKGDAPVSYDDPPTAKAAVEWFDGKDFQGSKLKVSLARKRPPMNSMWGGMPLREGRGMPPPLRAGPGGPEVLGEPMGQMGGHGGVRGGFPPRGSRGSQRNPSGGGNCPSPRCGNQNFAWRTECNQCKAPKPEGFLPPPFSPFRGGPGGMRGGRGGLMDRGGPGRMFRGSRGGDRGGFHGGRGMDLGGFSGGRRGGAGGPRGPLMEHMGGRRGGHGGPGKMDKGEHPQERRDWPY
uniref:EWS RNA binding protein 1 n=1 Tax=Saimiri boliviensis boliviensis TaxID=39432 RepID=A0A2K6TKT7_SAIBB